MAVQNRTDINNVALIRFGIAATLQAAILLQDAGRTEVLKYGTLMAKVAASQKWVPFTNEAATNGSAHPQGIYIGPDVAASDLVAGDVENAHILVGNGVFIDENQLVIENSKTLDTVITVGTTDLRTVRDHLACRGIFVESTVDISSFEN